MKTRNALGGDSKLKRAEENVVNTYDDAPPCSTITMAWFTAKLIIRSRTSVVRRRIAAIVDSLMTSRHEV